MLISTGLIHHVPYAGVSSLTLRFLFSRTDGRTRARDEDEEDSDAKEGGEVFHARGGGEAGVEPRGAADRLTDRRRYVSSLQL